LKPSNERGFTLIEVLVAMVILTIALVSMAELMAITLRMQQLGRNQTAAIRLAQDKIDELMNQNYTDVRLAIGGSLTADQTNHFDVPQDEDGNSLGYTRRWTVAAGPVDPAAVGNGATRVLTVRIIPMLNNTRTAPPTDITTLIRCWPC
jgi:prepilin-type N-terminal cleavage/methylation domain-containing protein